MKRLFTFLLLIVLLLSAAGIALPTYASEEKGAITAYKAQLTVLDQRGCEIGIYINSPTGTLLEKEKELKDGKIRLGGGYVVEYAGFQPTYSYEVIYYANEYFSVEILPHHLGALIHYPALGPTTLISRILNEETREEAAAELETFFSKVKTADDMPKMAAELCAMIGGSYEQPRGNSLWLLIIVIIGSAILVVTLFLLTKKKSGIRMGALCLSAMILLGWICSPIPVNAADELKFDIIYIDWYINLTVVDQRDFEFYVELTSKPTSPHPETIIDQSRIEKPTGALYPDDASVLACESDFDLRSLEDIEDSCGMGRFVWFASEGKTTGIKYYGENVFFSVGACPESLLKDYPSEGAETMLSRLLDTHTAEAAANELEDFFLQIEDATDAAQLTTKLDEIFVLKEKEAAPRWPIIAAIGGGVAVIAAVPVSLLVIKRKRQKEAV